MNDPTDPPDPPLHCTPGMQVLLSTDAGLQVLPKQVLLEGLFLCP